MKKMTALTVAAAVLLLTVSACSSNEEGLEAPVVVSEATAAQNGGGGAGPDDADPVLQFTYGTASFTVDDEAAPVIEALGDNYSYFEAQSCAFQGMDRAYTYPSLVIWTYEDEGVEKIRSITLSDDTVATPEGIYLGSTADDVLAAYDMEPDVNSSEQISYFDGRTSLDFNITDGTVSYICYQSNVMPDA